MSSEDHPVQWPQQWLRGALELCVLAVVHACEEAGEESYGYLIAQRLQQAGLGSITGGTLYPILIRLEKESLVSSRWGEGQGGPGRKYFQLTPAGRQRLTQQAPQWAAFAARTTALLTPTPAPHHP